MAYAGEAFPDRRAIWDELSDGQRRVVLRLALQLKKGTSNDDILASLTRRLGE